MAKRPVFIPGIGPERLVITRDVEFTWHAGLALSQKRKSIASLHAAARSTGIAERLLEISTKSPTDAGIQLSAFNLRFNESHWPSCSVEAAFQSSKAFEEGGPFPDIAAMSSLDAKRDARLRTSGRLIAFHFRGSQWGLRPRTAFYDWLYVNALQQNPELGKVVTAHDAFTDIEFNPEKSINSQAHSAAVFVALTRAGTLAEALSSPDAFRAAIGSAEGRGSAPQGQLL